MLLSRYNHLLVGRACCFWAMPRSGTSSTSWSNSVELQSPMNGMWKIWALSRLMFKIWFDLWQGGADKDTSPNASIAGESAALPSFQSVARQAWPSTLPTPASVGCQLIWISRPFQNQKQKFNVLPMKFTWGCTASYPPRSQSTPQSRHELEARRVLIERLTKMRHESRLCLFSTQSTCRFACKAIEVETSELPNLICLSRTWYLAFCNDLP